MRGDGADAGEVARADEPARIPYRLRKRPTHGGLPVPYLVAIIDGRPDFRCAAAQHVERCMRERRCGLCGQPLERAMVFIGGPGIKEGRLTSEPPAHEECSRYALVACPYLTGKKRRRTGPQEWAERGAAPMEGLYDHAADGGTLFLLWTERYRPYLREETGVWYFSCAPWVKVEEMSNAR